MGRWAGLDRRWKLGGAVGLGAVVAALVGITVAVLAGSGGGSADDASETPSPTVATATATPSRTPTTTPTPSPTPILYSGIFDGVVMTAEEWEARKDLLPVGLMIDNNPAGFPQAGLDKADIVYEAFVEGRITRFLAVFWRQDADFIEPIRSARTPFVIWASELGLLYGHAGSADLPGPACAGCQIREWGILDVDSFRTGSGTYYRDTQRPAPHNLVTTTQRIRDAGAIFGYFGPPTVEPWLFKDDFEDTEAAEAVGGIEVLWGPRNFSRHIVQWHWDEPSNTYLRFTFGVAHTDALTAEPLRFKNVVVMVAPWRHADSAGHVTYEQYGTGPATVFLDGKVIPAEWRKADRTSRTRLFDLEGNEIRFNRGNIWVQLIGPGEQVTTASAAGELAALPPYTPPSVGSAADRDDTQPLAPTATTPPPTAAPTAEPSPPTPTTAPAPTEPADEEAD